MQKWGVPGPGRQRSSREPADKGAAGSGSQPTRGPNRGIQGWPLSKGGSGVHYPRVAIIQGWIMGPLSKGGHYSRAGHYPRAGRAADTRNALLTFCKGALREVAHNGGFPGRGQAAERASGRPHAPSKKQGDPLATQRLRHLARHSRRSPYTTLTLVIRNTRSCGQATRSHTMYSSRIVQRPNS